MKRTTVLLSIVLLALFLASSMPLALAVENGLDCGYMATSDREGKDVASGTPVTITGVSTDPRVFFVVFKWYAPDGHLSRFQIKNAWANGTVWTNVTGSYELIYSKDTYIPPTGGHWRVEVMFWTVKRARLFCIWPKLISVKSTYFNMIPEVQIVGTAGILTAMFAGLFIFKRKGHHETSETSVKI